MDHKKRNVLIGLFVLGGLASLAVLIVKFGEVRSLFGNRYVVSARYERITGVREGTEVRLAGVWIGSVQDVLLDDPSRPDLGVKVIMEIDSRYVIPSGSEANIILPLMGQAAINIIPPPELTEPLPRDGTGVVHGKLVNPLEQVIDPRMMITLETTTRQIGTLAEALTPAAHDIHVLLQRRTAAEVDAATSGPTGAEISANLYTAVDRLHNVLKHIDTVLGDPAVQSNVKEALADFRAASTEARTAAEGFRRFSEGLQRTNDQAQAVLVKVNDTVETTHQHINALGRKLQANSDQLARLLDYFTAAGRDIAEGRGTIGLLLRDPKFYEELLLTMQRLGAAAQDMQVVVRQWQDGGLQLRLR
jgi:phospholipid/cholesterol/gamma-HCH transport system substrate-binding protein